MEAKPQGGRGCSGTHRKESSKLVPSVTFGRAGSAKGDSTCSREDFGELSPPKDKSPYRTLVMHGSGICQRELVSTAVPRLARHQRRAVSSPWGARLMEKHRQVSSCPKGCGGTEAAGQPRHGSLPSCSTPGTGFLPFRTKAALNPAALITKLLPRFP